MDTEQKNIISHTEAMFEASDMLNMMEEDAAQAEIAIPQVDKLKELSEMIDEMWKLQRDMLKLQEHLAKLSEAYNTINTLKIPDLFEELGLKKFTLNDGRIVEVTGKYAGSISTDNADACFQWLQEHGHEGIIKHEVKVKLKKGQDEEHEKILTCLMQEKVSFDDKKSVHPQTLSAFIREQIENGADFPQELFKVVKLRSTKIK